MFKNGMRPVHPGEILLEDYIKPLGISVRALSLALHVPYSRLREVVDGNRGVSADTALRMQKRTLRCWAWRRPPMACSHCRPKACATGAANHLPQPY